MKRIHHKKSLGQNFLRNRRAVERIAESAQVTRDDTVIEIGAGDGALTEVLAQRAKKVIAIELDEALVSVLQKKFFQEENVVIIHDDVLHLNVPQLVLEYAQNKHYKVVANIPYYITAPIIRLFLETTYKPQEMILMVQKEVARRITAQPGQMSILAVSAQYYADVSYLFDVPKEYFDPVPQVDSATVKLKIHGRKCKIKNEENFFRIVRIGFSARRKTLANNLANGLYCDKKHITKIMRQCGLQENVRAQELSIENWCALAQSIDDAGYLISANTRNTL